MECSAKIIRFLYSNKHKMNLLVFNLLELIVGKRDFNLVCEPLVKLLLAHKLGDSTDNCLELFSQSHFYLSFIIH